MLRILRMGGLALAFVAAVGPGFAQNPKSLIGQKAPTLIVSNWLNTGGKPLDLARLRGKVVVLDFWAYW